MRWYEIKEGLFILGVIVLLVGGFLGTVFGVSYFCSVQEAKVLNAKYDTNFTVWDILYAGPTLKQNLIGKKT